MKKLILILALPFMAFSQDCYTVKSVTANPKIQELNQKRIIFGIKQMVEEVIGDNYTICEDGIPVTVEVLSVEAPSKGISIGPFSKKSKETVVKLKINTGGQIDYVEGKAKTTVQSTFLDLNNEDLPFNKTTFSSAIKKAIEQLPL